jgi:hypothetical protein
MSSRKSVALRQIAGLRLSDTESWLALAEDQLRDTVPPNSQVFARFLELKEASKSARGSPVQTDSTRDTEEVRSLLVATCDWLDAQPSPPPDNLKEEIENIIQTGYFKSPYFRTILILFGIALALISGIASFKIHDQVQEMKRMLDEARRQTADMAQEIAAAKAENKNREADLALLVAQGNVDLAKQRANALSEIQQSTDLFRTDLDSRTKRWTDDVEHAASEAKQHIIEAGGAGEKQVTKITESTLTHYQKQIADTLESALSSLQASENPWVPKVIWSVSKKWLFVPLALFISLTALLIVVFEHFKFRNVIINGVIAVSAGATIAILLFIK